MPITIETLSETIKERILKISSLIPDLSQNVLPCFILIKSFRFLNTKICQPKNKWDKALTNINLSKSEKRCMIFYNLTYVTRNKSLLDAKVIEDRKHTNSVTQQNLWFYIWEKCELGESRVTVTATFELNQVTGS